MGQELTFKKKLGVAQSVLLDVSLCTASFGYVIKGLFLRVDNLGFFKTGTKYLRHLSVVRAVKANLGKDRFIRKAAQSSEKNHQWDLLFELGYSNIEALTELIGSTLLSTFMLALQKHLQKLRWSIGALSL